jgi:RNA polymerase sigma-70 factor (ECF subfamily)
VSETEKENLFKVIYTDYSTKVQRLCLGYTGNVAEAEDLLQETFIKAWQNFDKFRGDSQVSTWIYRIAVNTCLQYIKKQKTKNKIDVDLVANKIKETEDTKEEQVQLLYKCISMLAEVDRVIITLLLEEVSYAEIATITAISEGNLRVKIHRIKQQISNLYSKYESI